MLQNIECKFCKLMMNFQEHRHLRQEVALQVNTQVEVTKRITTQSKKQTPANQI